MNRTLVRHASPALFVRNGANAPRFRLKPSAAAIRSAILAFSCTTVPAFAQGPATGTLPTGGAVQSGTATIGAPGDLGDRGDLDRLDRPTDLGEACIDWQTGNYGRC